MQIGPLIISRSDQVALATKKAATGERGKSELYSMGGYLSIADERIDHLADMRPPERFANVDKMRRSDASVRAAFLAVALPILSAPLTVKPGGTDPLDREIADFIRDDLQNMTIDLAQHRWESLLSLAYGVAPFEVVNEIREDGKLHLRKLAYRPASTIAGDGWLTDEHGGPMGLVQLDPMGMPIELGMERLLIFVNEREGANLTGNSIFRAAFKHWYYKYKLEEIAAISAERQQGIPVGKQRGNNTTVQSYIERVLMGVRQHGKMFVRETEDFDFRLEGVRGDTTDPLPLIQYHRTEIFVSMLADFLALGSGDSGSWALAKDKTSFFLMALRSVMANLEGTYNRYLIPRWVGANWANVPRSSLPQLVHGPLNTRDVAAWFEAVERGVKGGFLDNDDQLRAMARDYLDLPAKVTDKPLPTSADDAAAEKPLEAGDEQPVQNAEAWPGVSLAEPTRLESVVKLEALGIQPRFEIMEGRMDKGASSIAESVGALQKKAAKRTAAEVYKLLRDGDVDSLADALRALDVPAGEEEAAILAELEAIYELGVDEYWGELRDQGGQATERPDAERSGSDLGLLAAIAAGLAGGLADRMKQAAISAGLQGLVTGQLDRNALLAAIGPASEKLLGQLALQGVALALNVGRQSVADANAERIDREIYTAAMDDNTCQPCAKYDGQEFAVGEGPACPNPECEGGARCRCTRVGVVKPARS